MDELDDMTEELWSGLSEKEREELRLKWTEAYIRGRDRKTIEVSDFIYQTTLWQAEVRGIPFDDALELIFNAGMYDLFREDDIRQSANREGDAVVYPFPRKGPDFRGQS